MNETNTIQVETGQVKAARAPMRLRCAALGSCVATILYDAEHQVGGIAHVMLPSTNIYIKGDELSKYAEFAIEELLRELMELGAAKDTIRARLVGGAMIVKDSIDIGKQNTAAVEKKLAELGIDVIARKDGGQERRSVVLDTATGTVWVSEGGGIEHAL